MKIKTFLYILIVLIMGSGCKSTRVVLQMDEIRPVLEEKNDIRIEFTDSSQIKKRFLKGESYDFINDTLITPYNVYLSKPDTFRVPLHKITRVEYTGTDLATTILLGTALLLAGWLLLL